MILLGIIFLLFTQMFFISEKSYAGEAEKATNIIMVLRGVANQEKI